MVEKLKLNYKKTFTLGFGFFAISLVWPLYNSFVPIFLEKYISSVFLIGLIMTLDNIAAITLQPYFGAKSDSTFNRFGRRMPYLLIGIPISAVLFVLIPFETNLWYLLSVLFIFNLSMTIYRAPTVALMPDITPIPLRSKANGIINLMGGLGAVLAFFVGSQLYNANKTYPFILSSTLMMIVTFILYFTIKEPKKAVISKEDNKGIVSALWNEVIKGENKTILFILLAVLFWFLGYQGVEASFSLYVKNFLGQDESKAAFTLGFFSITFLLMAIPSGLLGTRFGKTKVIKVGIAGLLLVFLGCSIARSLSMLRILFAIGGIFWACININSYPMVVELTTEEKIGTYTGLYYLFSSMAAIGGPPIFGIIIDIFGYGTVFYIAVACFILAMLCVMRIGKAKKTGIKTI